MNTETASQTTAAAPRRRDRLGGLHGRGARRGAAVVEFAVLAPVLFLLIFGMIEFGRMVMVQQILTNASREGARVGILDGSTTQQVRDAVIDKVGGSVPLTDDDIDVDPDPPSNAAAGETVTVTVNISFDQVSWLPVPFWLSGKNMEASTSMRRETVQ